MSRRAVFGRTKSGTAYFPVANTTNVRIIFSTRVGDSIINLGDGSALINETNLKNEDFTTYINSPSPLKNYTSIFTGNTLIKFINGLKDVYSWFYIVGGSGDGFGTNITNLENFLAQFPNLYSLQINVPIVSPSIHTIIGDWAKIPINLEKIKLTNIEGIANVATNLILNVNNYPIGSKLKYFNCSTSIKLNGDLNKIPTSCNFFYINSVYAGSTITYTAGKTWASSFDTLYLPIALTTTETDNLLIDANNSITTSIGGKSFTLQGYRTSASNSAVSGLIAKGFTINCALSERLIMPLSSNLIDLSTFVNNATMVGTETHSLSGLVTSIGNYAYIPNKTSLDFGTGSLRFGCTVKFSAITGTKGLIGKTVAAGAVGRYGIFIDSSTIYGISQITSGTILGGTSITPYNDGNFHTIEVICNRTSGKQTLTIDGALIDTQNFTPASDNIGTNARFMLGAYGNSTGNGLLAASELSGIIKDVFVNKF